MYDRQYRWEALARKDLNWSVQDSRLYNEAFISWDQAIARYNVCQQDDYTASCCPRNPHQLMLAWLPDVSSWSGAGFTAHRTQSQQAHLVLQSVIYRSSWRILGDGGYIFDQMAPDLLAYQSCIIWAEPKLERKHWQTCQSWLPLKLVTTSINAGHSTTFAGHFAGLA